LSFILKSASNISYYAIFELDNRLKTAAPKEAWQVERAP